MAVLEGPVSLAQAEVDPTPDALRVAPYPKEVAGLYSARMTTGVIAAALAVDAPIFGIRHAAVPTKDVYILRIMGAFSWVVAATAAQQFGLYLERFTVANLAGGTSELAAIAKHDTNYPASQVQDIRHSSTVALTSAGVTFAGDKVPVMGWTNSAIGTGVNDMPTLFDAGESGPIRLRAGEGLSLRNLIVWPAAGTGVFTGRIAWEER